MDLELYYEIKTSTKEVKVPRRIYKNPIYQRLANRWYGMDTVGMLVTVSARPRRSSLMFLSDPEPIPASWYDARFAPNVSASVACNSVELKAYDYTLEVPIDAWHAHNRTVVNRALSEMRQVLQYAGERLTRKAQVRGSQLVFGGRENGFSV